MKIKSLLLGAAMAASLAAPSAFASIVNAPVPTNAYIVLGGLDWAWASPVQESGQGYSDPIDLSYESQFGWRLPTADELLSAPVATDFIFAGANVPLGGTDPVSGAYFAYSSPTLTGAAASAVAYFQNSYLNSDWCNAPGSSCGFGEVPWSGQPGSAAYSESLVVRDAGGVPEPATWAMMLVGFGGLGAAMRSARRKSASAATA